MSEPEKSEPEPLLEMEELVARQIARFYHALIKEKVPENVAKDLAMTYLASGRNMS